MTFGQRIDRFYSGDYQDIKEKKSTLGSEFVFFKEGGVEKIRMNGFIVESNHQQMLTFMHNAIVGPLGKIGTLVVDAATETEVFFESISMERIIGGSTMKWTAVFTTSLKC